MLPTARAEGFYIIADSRRDLCVALIPDHALCSAGHRRSQHAGRSFDSTFTVGERTPLRGLLASVRAISMVEHACLSYTPTLMKLMAIRHKAQIVG